MKSKKLKVFLTGGDGNGWALDEDLAMTKQAIADLVEFTDLDHSDIIHSVWWGSFNSLDHQKLKQRKLICQLSGEPYRYLSVPEFKALPGLINVWVSQTAQAAKQLTKLGYPCELVPYAVDTTTFKPVEKGLKEIESIFDLWGVPRDKYLIGSFQRDTEGRNLQDPKLVKGPDIFFEIIKALWMRKLPIHVILAGPRRNWLRKQLSEEGIPFTFIGKPTDEDDLYLNTLPKETINLLYNLIDLYLISSRSEGGPRAVLEAAATHCKAVSTPVGLALDVLTPECVYQSPISAVEIIERDIRNSFLDRFSHKHFKTVEENHLPSKNTERFRKLYERVMEMPGQAKFYPGKEVQRLWTLIKKSPSPAANRPPQEKEFQVGLWHKFFAPPYGGGNQFMIILRKALLQRGVHVAENILDPEIDAYLLNSIHFDIEQFQKYRLHNRIKAVHRIDGPINLIRGKDRDKDELCYELNASLAFCTIIQSNWTLERIIEMGYHPVKPVIIHNMVDDEIYHRNGKVPFDPSRKVRLISTSWSGNPRKGGPVYKWIEENLDWDHFEYTFVGQVSEQFEHVKHIPPVPSQELADLLRQHDIYITASQNDPCSNALIEALSCGLPALYLNDGGHPELVGQGGLPFNSRDEIFPQLEKLVENYSLFQNLITVPSVQEVTGKYLKLLKEAGQSE